MKASSTWELLSQCHKLFSNLIVYELKKFDITVPQMMVLDQIKEGSKTIGEISKAIDLSYSTVSGIVDRLENNQLVQRIRSQTDRRIVHVEITHHFKEMGKNIPLLYESYYEEMFGELSKEEKEMILKSIAIMNELLQKKEVK